MQIDVSESQNGQSITARVGDMIALRLPENSTTGYRWMLGEFDATRMAVSDSGYQSESRSVGGAGFIFWMLHCLSDGKVLIVAKKWRPWEGDRSIIDRFSVEIEIQPPEQKS